MSFRLKNVLLFVIIICMFTMLIGCRNERQDEELLVETTEAKDEEPTEVEINKDIAEENSEESEPVKETEPTETTVATEPVSTNNTTEKVEESKPIVEYPITEPTTEHQEEDYTPEIPEATEAPETIEPTEEIETETETETENEVEVEEDEVTTEDGSSSLVSLGQFKLTAYCACSRCCGKSDGITATGTTATQGRTIAVDPSVIPYGTAVTINGNTYIAEDCGGAIKTNRIDIFFDSHQEALDFGVQYAEVFVEED